MSTLHRTAPETHRLSVLTDHDEHGQPLSPGQLQVMRVRRVSTSSKGAGASPTVISLLGAPLSKASTATSATLTFVPTAMDMPKPMFDAVHGHITLYYPIADMPEVMKILGSRNDKLCYFWQTNDRQRTLAWLIAMP